MFSHQLSLSIKLHTLENLIKLKVLVASLTFSYYFDSVFVTGPNKHFYWLK